MRNQMDVVTGLFCAVVLMVSAPVIARETSPMQLGIPYQVRASSELAGGNHLYAARQVIPPSLGTAWCEGAAGDGVGEWLELTVEPPKSLEGELDLEILPGYVSTLGTYRKNNRPKKIAVTFNDEPKEQVVELQDYGRYQIFPFKRQREMVKKIRLKILEVYKGTQHDDTCITDVLLQEWPEPDARPVDGEMPEMRMLYKAKPLAGTRDYMSFAMGLSDGTPPRGAADSEILDEVYLLSLVRDNPGIFLWALDKQNDRVAQAVMKAIVSPIDDRYSDQQVRGAIIKGLQGLDVQSTARLKPLLDAYSIK